MACVSEAGREVGLALDSRKRFRRAVRCPISPDARFSANVSRSGPAGSGYTQTLKAGVRLTRQLCRMARMSARVARSLV